MQNFTIYSKDGCPYCEKIEEVMKLAKLSHVIYKLDEDFNKDGFYGQFGEGSTFPQVVLNGDQMIVKLMLTVLFTLILHLLRVLS